MNEGEGMGGLSAELKNPDPRLLWVLARLLCGLPAEREIGQLPEQWQDRCRQLEILPQQDRMSELYCQLSGSPNSEIESFIASIVAVDPRDPARSTPFPFPHTLIDGKRKTESSGFETLSLKDILAMKDLQIEWLVQDLIPKGAIAILGGPPGKGKSWMLLDLALACISGRMWLGKFKTMSGRVLYIDEESPPALLRHRLNRLLTGWGGSIPDADLSVVLGQGLCLANDRSVDRLRYTVAAIHPTLVIVDSLIRVHGSEENSASEMAQVFAGVKSLVRDYGCSVVFADHQKKPGIGPVSQDLLLRGTTEKVAFVDTLLSLYSRDGALIVEHSKSRFAQPVPSFVIAIEDPEPDRTVVRVVGEAENLRQKEREERATEFVTRFLEDGEWKSRKGMAKAARASGVCVKAMDEVLKDFQDQGIVERDDRKPEHGRGGKSAYYRLVVTDDPVSDFPSIIKEENGNGVIEPGEPLLKTS